MIEGHCFTNLDDYRTTEWPSVFVAVPRVGEMVESVDGKRALKVVRVTHTALRDRCTGHHKPLISVELHR